MHMHMHVYIFFNGTFSILDESLFDLVTHTYIVWGIVYSFNQQIVSSIYSELNTSDSAE